MPLNPITVQLWDKTFTRLGYVGAITNVSATMRTNAASDCTFTIPTQVMNPRTREQVIHPRLANLMTQGCRAVVTYTYEQGMPPIRVISGRIQNRAGQGVLGQASRTFSIRDDWNLLASTLAWPTPAATIDNQDSVAYYKISGPAETAALDVIGKNAKDRLGRPLTIPADQGRGSSVSLQFRMDYLQDKLFPAITNAGILLDIGQVDDHLELSVSTPNIYPHTLTEGSGVVVGGSFSIDDVTATRVVVGVGSTGGTSSDTGATARIFREFINTDLEAQIGEPLEFYVDASDIDLTGDVTAQTQQQADNAFTDNAEKVNLDITLIETGAFKFAKTFQLGDVVPIQLNSSPVLTGPASEVDLVWQAGTGSDGGLTITPHVGDWQDDADSVLFNEAQQMGKAIRSLQRK